MKKVILVDRKGRKKLLELKDQVERIPDLGVIDFSNLPRDLEGRKVEIAGKEFIALTPSILDLVETIEREAQIITAKDSASIILNCNVKSGDSVLEIGTGSGALTIILGHFVSPGGRVVTYERREDFAKLARRNIERAGLENLIKVRNRDALEGIEERNYDCAVVDIPNPWEVLGHVYEALGAGGHLAVYVPSVNQMEKAVKRLREFPFIEVRSMEIIQREMVVGERGTRPSFDMLGHTGYLTFARKVLT